MKCLHKHIEFFQEDKYRDLEYGTIYYVAGTTTPQMNKEAKRSARSFARLINLDPDYWVNCKIIYLDSQNNLFAPREGAAFYTALIPTVDNLSKGYSFLVAELDECDKDLLFIAFDKYFSTLLKMFDEVLDKGVYSEHHLLFPEIIEFPENELQVGYIALAEGEAPISGLPPREHPRPVRRNALSRLVITPSTYQVTLPDYGKEVHFVPQVKAIYILYLKHPEGIIRKKIGDYKDELKKIFLCLTNRSDVEWAKTSIDKLLDVCDLNKLDSKKSQCNTILHQVIDQDELFQYYEIEAKRGRPHRIRLNRELVTLPESLL